MFPSCRYRRKHVLPDWHDILVFIYLYLYLLECSTFARFTDRHQENRREGRVRKVAGELGTQNVCGGAVYVEDEMKRFCDIDYYKLSEF